MSPGLAQVGKWFGGAAVSLGLALGGGSLVAGNDLGRGEAWIGFAAFLFLSIGIVLALIGTWVGSRTARRWWASRSETSMDPKLPQVRLQDPRVGTESISGAVVKTRTTHSDSTFTESSPERVWAEHPMAFCVLKVINDPPGRHPDAAAKHVFAEMAYDEVLPSGELRRFRHIDHGVWYGPPHLGTSPAEREAARFRDLQPNGDAQLLILARYNGEGMYAAFPGSFKSVGLRSEPWVIDDKWRLDGNEFKVTVTIRGNNLDDVVGYYRLVPDALQGIIVEEWKDDVSFAPLRRGRGQLAWRLKEWERIKNRLGNDPVIIEFGRGVFSDFADIKQAITRLGLVDSVSDVLSDPPDWSRWVQTERTQLPGRLETAIEEIERLISEQE